MASPVSTVTSTVTSPVTSPVSGPTKSAGPSLRSRRRALRLVGPSSTERRPVTVAQAVAAGLFLVTFLVAAFCGYLFIGSGLAASRTQDVLYHRLQRDLAAATVPVSGPIAPGTPLGVVRIPSIGLDQVFVEGSSSDQTSSGPGLETDTVLPGQAGVSVLVGHRVASGGAFGDLNRLRPGDRIDIVTGQGRFTYVVDLVRTSDAPAQQLPVVASRLNLVTSDPAYAPYRQLTVSAALRGAPKPASTGTTALASDRPGHGSADQLVDLLLWSQLLLLTTVVLTWAALRLPARGLWIGAVPVLLAILWQVFDQLALLLPNTL